MITALTLFKYALHLLTRSPLKTLEVVTPALVLMGAVGVFAAVTAPDLLANGPLLGDIDSFRDGLRMGGIALAFMFSYALMAILWHRHTLSDTCTPRRMSISLLAGYLWRVFALSLIQLAASFAMVVPLVVFSRTAQSADATPALASMLISTFITQLVLLWLSLRLSLILPAAALGKPIRMAQSWRYTVSIARPLWGVAAVLALSNTVLTGLVTAIDLASPGYRLAIELPVSVLEGLLIFSVLTALYSVQAPRNI